MVASSQDIHQHGRIQGSVVFDKTTIIIQLTLPALHVVGFEYAPQNDSEKELIKSSEERLKNMRFFEFFKITPFLNRRQALTLQPVVQHVHYSGELNSTNSKQQHEKHHHHDHHDEHNDNHNDHDQVTTNHSEFKIDIRYETTQSMTISGISTLIFQLFSDVEYVVLDVVDLTQQFQLTFDKKQELQKFPKPIVVYSRNE